jgi:hypothetical protein
LLRKHPLPYRLGVKSMTATTRLSSGTVQPFVFFREGHFYVVEIPPDQVLANVELNPGTIRVEDMKGNIVWRPQ